MKRRAFIGQWFVARWRNDRGCTYCTEAVRLMSWWIHAMGVIEHPRMVVTYLLLTCSRGFVVEEFQADSAPGILAALKIQKSFGSRWHYGGFYWVKLHLFATVEFPFKIMMLSWHSLTSHSLLDFNKSWTSPALGLYVSQGQNFMIMLIQVCCRQFYIAIKGNFHFLPRNSSRPCGQLLSQSDYF